MEKLNLLLEKASKALTSWLTLVKQKLINSAGQ